MLTGKQKRYLRSLASNEQAMFQIGKDALSDTLIHTVQNAFNTHELIKIRLLKTCPIDPKEAAFDLAMNTGSEVAQVIGHTIVLYKALKNPVIILP
ncbi:MAG: YhbY family RNA-binding protein [Solobacterium sp.]|nr:YhbY family RNA-binding protein [Solobacterium sp.]